MTAIARASAIRPAVFAVLAGAFALTSAFGAAAIVRRRVLRASHQQSTPERWFTPRADATPATLATGRRLFLNNCAHCHGSDARGDEGPDLHDVQVSDRYITNIVTRGLPHEMPSFGRKLKPDDVATLVAYVRSLR